MRKSWAYGAAAVLAVHALWSGLIYLQSRADWFMAAVLVMLFFAINAAGVGAFITAMTAPRNGFALGLTMAPLSAALTVGSNLAFEASGNRVDVSGFYDNWGLLAVSLGYGASVAAVGGLIGTWMKRRNGFNAPATDAPAVQTAAMVEPYISDPAAPPTGGPAPPMGHI